MRAIALALMLSHLGRVRSQVGVKDPARDTFIAAMAVAFLVCVVMGW